MCPASFYTMRITGSAIFCALMLSSTVRAADTDGLFRCEFESDSWFKGWGLKEVARNVELVAEDSDNKFTPHR